MLRRLYDKAMALAATPYAVPTLGAVSFAESSFSPLPPDVLLIPMVLANRARARFFALWCTLTSVAGGMLGYLIGSVLYESLGKWLIDFYGMADGIEDFRALYVQYGAAIILIKGLTPIPYKLVTLASGFAGYDFFLFLLLSLVTRGARFFITAEVLRIWGDPVREFIERRLMLVTSLLAAIVIGGFVLARYAL
jgi:membrane protein YqaA with SNARE-associated domain